MTLPLLAFITVAALIHASWNFVLKRVASDRYVVLWWSLVISTVLLIPAFFWPWHLSVGVLPYAIASALIETAYIGALSVAYGLSDFSLVYPIARGAAPVFVATWSLLFLGESINFYGALGLGIIVLGLMTVGSSGLWQSTGKTQVSQLSIGVALLIALFISGYSVIDGAAVKFSNPFQYLALVFGLIAIFAYPVIHLRSGPKAIGQAWQRYRTPILLIGALNLGGYSIVMFVYTVAQISYAGAIREMSVVFAALMGWRWLGEGFGLVRVVGALLIFTGIVVIALLG